jgi:hypothetical protein
MTVAGLAMWLSGLSFLVFLCASGFTFYTQWKAANGKAGPAAEVGSAVRAAAAAPPDLDKLTTLINALKDFTDVIVKAGPVLSSLVASILFLGIATWASAQDKPTTCSIPAGTALPAAGAPPLIIQCTKGPAPSNG